ncbi:PspC domain-containing protein [Candidatus Saccharibacteria bacterium]|nr:PspC domain-containing protein [Candidatus Saccharibacteria bacterium]
MKRLYRSETDKKLGGVCGGLGEYFGLDPVLFRIGFVVATVAGAVPGILPYIVLWILIPTKSALPPEHDDDTTAKSE